MRRLGQGGMAEVFEGELVGELGFTRKVAIKRVLAEAATDPVASRRFLDEARIASRLHHANIVAVLDVGLLEGLPFQVLELVDGINAQQVMQRGAGPLPAEVALIIAAEVARALDHAHTASDADGVPLGIVHRDVKPSNVLLSWNGDVKLSDFGIALAHDRGSRTETGIVAGTMGFMAPEQRHRAQLDGRTDVFALGLTLHALLTGASPFQDITVELATLAGEPVALAPTIPADVAPVLARALAVARLDRPDAGELAEQLSRSVRARVTRDPRSVLREFLAPYATTPGRRAGALDQLLGIELVASASDASGVQRYELHQARADASRAEVATSPQTPRRTRARDASEDSPSSIAAHPTKPPSRWQPAVAGLVAIGALGGVAAWRLSNHDDVPQWPPQPPGTTTIAKSDPAVVVPDAAVTVAASPSPSTIAAAPVGQASVRPLEPAAQDSPTPVRVPISRSPAQLRTHARSPSPSPSPSPPTAPSPAPASAPAPPAAEGTGYLQATGEDILRGRVIVDGVLRGYAPAKLELPRGHHVVIVEKPDGTRSQPHDVEITDVATFASPVRVTW